MKKHISVCMAVCMTLMVGLCAISFAACTGENKEPSKEKVQIYTPDGAPALSLAKLMAEDTDADDTEYHVVDSTTIGGYVTGKEAKADLCVLPVNLASKLLGTGETYRMLGTVTHGNLYILSTDDSVSLETGEDLFSLQGKTVGVIQIANVPGLTFKTVLNKYGVEWQELSGDATPSAEKVNLQGISNPSTGVSPAGGCDYYIAAEPLVTAKTSATSLSVVGDLQSLYGGEQGYPQAVLVANSSFIRTHGEWIHSFTAKLSESAEWLKTAQTQTVVSAVETHLTEGLKPTFSAQNLSAAVISRCSIRFVTAQEAKAETLKFLDELIAVNAGAAAKVSDAFFYGV